MPSRRDVLTILSIGAAGGSLAGCSALASVGGYVRKKTIRGTRRVNGGLHGETIVSIGLDDAADKPVVTVAERWADRFSNLKQLHVSAALNDRLRTEYEELGYVISVCSPDWSNKANSLGCYTAPTKRDDFNRAQVGDRVRARYANSTIEIRSVEGTWTTSS